MIQIKRYYITHVAVVLLLCALSNLAVQQKSLLILLIGVICNFVAIATMPIFKQYPSLWMFVIFAFTSAPLNFILVRKIVYATLQVYGIEAVLIGSIIYLGIFCVEEIILGIATRLIWKNQRKLMI